MVVVAMVHPDLGIGGAERLIVDAALALQRRGHRVVVFTAHHDPRHAFTETTDGSVAVQCVGDWLPRSTLGRLAAFWAYVRMVYVALYVVLASGLCYDVAIVDQVSACVPVLRLRRQSKVLFYCHFPDQLLTHRKGWLKSAYRSVLDAVEERTTGMAHRVLVNSRFTGQVFRDTFRSLDMEPAVLYPSLDTTKFDALRSLSLEDAGLDPALAGRRLVLSLNRYERKKNLWLAVDALAALQETQGPRATDVHLVVAGGYDHRVDENVEHHRELVAHAEALNLTKSITFLRSPSDTKKVALLAAASCLVYTPDREHFGIVPLEAMYLGTPVVAVASGGPMETVVSGTTGFLCPPTPQDFADAIATIVLDTDAAATMATNATARVTQHFSFAAFTANLDAIVTDLTKS